MAEPAHRRARRPDSKQMWDESDRRAAAPLPTRERDEPRRDDRRDDRDRNRRYRSRSPRDSRGGRGGDRDRRRDDRDSRDGGRVRNDRDRTGRRVDDRHRDRGKLLPVVSGNFALRQRPDNAAQDGAREKPRQRSRERDPERERDPGRRVTRSRSPRRERDREGRRDEVEDLKHGIKKENVATPKLDDELPMKSRTATPPVSFKVALAPAAQDHDRMDVDSRPKPKGKKGKKAVEDTTEDDEEIVIEDDGMAAMQAMMGFGGFSTTQNMKIPGNDISAVRKEKKTEYRQYMNRVGGFNRPLSPPRES